MKTANKKIKNIELKREDFTKEQMVEIEKKNDELEMKIKKAGITIW